VIQDLLLVVVYAKYISRVHLHLEKKQSVVHVFSLYCTILSFPDLPITTIVKCDLYQHTYVCICNNTGVQALLNKISKTMAE